MAISIIQKIPVEKEILLTVTVNIKSIQSRIAKLEVFP